MRKCCPQVVNKKPECEEAFHSLKESLCVPPVLASPNFNQPFVIQTDASEWGIGTALSQLVGDQQEHPVMFLSRKLLPREQNYATVQKECLAVVWTIQSLQVYLYGQEFTVQSDHHALQWLERMKDKNPRLTRWSLTLQSYKYTVQHKPGKKENVNADALSRAFRQGCVWLCGTWELEMFSSSETLFHKHLWNFDIELFPFLYLFLLVTRDRLL